MITMGLFGFGNKTKYVDEPDTTVNKSEKKEAFFLSPDEAQTLGDVEYMRKKVTIKRTFPKMKDSQGAVVINEVSATEQKIMKGNETIVSESANNTTTPQVETSNSNPRRRLDSSMDMFRNMAKEIKK
jgi:hypothetical protein